MMDTTNDRPAARFDFESFKQAAIKGLYEGKPLTGENGLFAPLLKHFLESALEPGRRSGGNGWALSADSPDRAKSVKWQEHGTGRPARPSNPALACWT